MEEPAIAILVLLLPRGVETAKVCGVAVQGIGVVLDGGFVLDFDFVVLVQQHVFN
jgi:hypothetical protein